MRLVLNMQCRECRKNIIEAKGFWLPYMGFYCSWCAEKILLFWKKELNSWYKNIKDHNDIKRKKIQKRKEAKQ